MRINFIGTGSGKTSKTRFHTAILLDFGNLLLIDAGDGISKALQFSDIKYSRIEYIIITHFHPDHISGLPMLLNQMKMYNRKNDLHIYAFEKQLNNIKQLCEINLIFLDRLGFEVILKPFRDNQNFNLAEKITIIPRANSHLNKLKKNDIKCFSLFFEPENIHYSSDVNEIDDLRLFNDKSARYLISECTHIKPADIITSISMDQLEKVFFVHLDSEEELSSWHSALPEREKEKIIFTQDGLQYVL